MYECVFGAISDGGSDVVDEAVVDGKIFVSLHCQEMFVFELLKLCCSSGAKWVVIFPRGGLPIWTVEPHTQWKLCGVRFGGGVVWRALLLFASERFFYRWGYQCPSPACHDGGAAMAQPRSLISEVE